MKAILVVDIPIKMLNDNTCVTITSLDSGMSFNAKLKRMPKKKKGKKEFGWNCCEYTKFTEFEDGWNACLKEIEK